MPELASSFCESSRRSRSVSRSGRATSCSTRYSARSSSAIAARTMARTSLRLSVGRRTCPSAAPLDRAALRRKLALAFRFAHSRKRIDAPEEPSDVTARRLKCSESNASNQKAFDTKCIRSGGAGFGLFAMRSSYNPLAWHHPKGLALSEEQSCGTARFQTDNGGLHDRPRPVQATSATST